MQYVMRAVALASVLVWTARAHAFAEDICYTPGGGPLFTCLPLPESCYPLGTDDAQCQADLLTARAQIVADGGRSAVHTDATYVMAQAVGFSRDDAYWIAAYDEATDLGTFEARSMQSAVDTSYPTTANINGVTRNNFATGGVLFHFHAPRNDGQDVPSTTVDGLAPDVDDATTEVMLAHLRAWAMESPLACTGGLTLRAAPGNYAEGDACFERHDVPGSIDGSLTAFGPVAVPINVSTGQQVIFNDDDTTVYADGFDDYVGEARASAARIGIYIHALADRVSHHVCTDGTALAGPSASGAFTENMDTRDCAQGYHVVRHAWETGVDFDTLAPEHQTTRAALSATYDELMNLAAARGVLDASAASVRATLVDALGTALKEPDAVARVTAIASIACQAGLTPLPGTPDCTP